MINKKDGTTDWSATIQWIVIIGLVVMGIYKILNRPDRELTTQEKRDNVSVCHQYYGTGQAYEDCVNGNSNRD